MSKGVPRSGRCAIIGRPNVGKSTLLNTLLGQKLAIATSKPQTTRSCILGIYLSHHPPTQIAFIDTPGLHRPRNALGRAIVEQAKGSLVDAEVILVLAEISKYFTAERIDSYLADENSEVLKNLEHTSLPVILAINKVDRLADKKLLLPLIDRCLNEFPFETIIPISALKGENCQALIKEIRRFLPEGLRYQKETLTDKPNRFFAAELVREAIIRHTRQELPYSIAVLIDQYREEPNLVRISATIVVEKKAHKGIIIGKGGELIKSIGFSARQEIEAFISRKVFLTLWVKVMEGWTSNPTSVRYLTRQIESTNGV